MNDWFSKIYVATKTLGVYYTDNFVDPSIQPTWTAVNSGLPSTACLEFWLDPFNPQGKQYVLLSDRNLYMRTDGGDWTVIMSAAQCQTLTSKTGGYIVYFCVDEATPGRLWVMYGASLTEQPQGYYPIYTDDYGANWIAATPCYQNIFTYGCYGIRAHGDYVYTMLSVYAGGYSRMYCSSDKGGSWVTAGFELYTSYPMAFNKLTPTWAYTGNDVIGAANLAKATSAGSMVTLMPGLFLPRNDCMWFHPTDTSRQRLIKNSRVYVTNDAWATRSSPSAISPAPYSIAPACSAGSDKMLVGLTLGNHVVGCLDNEADVTATGIAGTLAGTSPYTDSIPKTCGGLATMGVQAIKCDIFTNGVNFYGEYQ